MGHKRLIKGSQRTQMTNKGAPKGEEAHESRAKKRKEGKLKMSEIKNETNLKKEIFKRLNQNKPSDLKRIEKFVNLANKNFEGVWSGWYKGETPPNMEIDLLFAFEDFHKMIDDALIIGTEVKFFKELSGFYEGLGQVLSYSLFGLDGLSLWHLFSKEVEENKIQNFANATKGIIEGFNLPIFYLCAKIIDEEELKIKSFAPSEGTEGEIKYFVEWMRDYVMDKNKRNPLLFEDKPLGPRPDEIRKRRKTFKAVFRIP